MHHYQKAPFGKIYYKKRKKKKRKTYHYSTPEEEAAAHAGDYTLVVAESRKRLLDDTH